MILTFKELKPGKLYLYTKKYQHSVGNSISVTELVMFISEKQIMETLYQCKFLYHNGKIESIVFSENDTFEHFEEVYDQP